MTEFVSNASCVKPLSVFQPNFIYFRRFMKIKYYQDISIEDNIDTNTEIPKPVLVLL